MDTSNYTIKLGLGKYNYLDKAYYRLIRNQIFRDETWIERWETYDVIIKEIIKLGNEEIFEEIKYRVTGGESINKVLLSIVNDELKNNITIHSLFYKIKEYEDIDWLKNFYQ